MADRAPAGQAEVELKLAVVGAFEPDDLAGDGPVAEVRPRPALDLRATYYDTPDLRLARHGVQLRHRAGEAGGPRWTLKLPMTAAGDARQLARSEIELAAPAGRVPAQAADLVTAYARTAALGPVSTIHTKRRRWSLMGPDGGELAELDDDDVSVMSGRHVVARFRELELEARHAAPAELGRIVDRLRAAGAVSAEPIPKVVRALGPAATAAPELEVPSPSPDLPAGVAVRAAMAAGVQRLVSHDAGTRIGDAESLHQMRVALRRLRSDLRTFGPLVESDWASALRDELSSLGDRLGAVRDLDVMIERLYDMAGDLRPALKPLFDTLAARHDRAREHLLAGLRSEAYPALLERLVGAAIDPRLAPAAEEAAAEALPPLVAGAWQRLAKRAEQLASASPDSAYHDARIRAKRVRYAAEAVAPALDAESSAAATSLARRLADVQDLLGGMQDAIVAMAELKAAADERPTDGTFSLAVGRLLEREALVAHEARAAFPSLWTDLRRKRWRRWLEA